MRPWRWSVVLLLGVTVASGGRPSFEEHAAVQESLSRVHPRMRASWLKERGIEDPYYTSVRTDSESTGLRCIGRWSYGPSYDVDGRTTPTETLVALARGSGVSLLRFSRQDSLSIELLSDINAEGLMCRVKVVDTLLYVGSRRGLEVYNIADEQNPARLSWTPIPLNDFALQDSLAYTISGDDSFRIYNVSNPASPVFRGACRDSGDLVSVAGNAAFLGDRWGLYVIDVANPTSPHRIGAWGSAIEQVQARGHLCYVTTFNPNQPGDITFHILDVAVPSLPYQIGSLDSAGGNDVFLIDTLAYGAGETDFNELTIISVADSTEPRLVGSDATRGWSYGIWASGLAQETFVGCHWEGLQIYDTRNTAQPVRDTGLLGADMAVDVEVDGGKAYVAGYRSGLQILDITSPTLPTRIGFYDSGKTVRSATARDSFAFISGPRPRMLTVDVSDPAHPVTAGGCEGMFNPPEDMVIRDSFVYCAMVNRFQVVNVAQPREPALVGSCSSQDGTYFGLAFQDSYAYLISGWLQIIDVSDPNAPFVVSTTNGGATGIAVRDTFAYIPNAYDSVRVYSVADPASPRLLSSTPAGVWPWDAALGESMLYVGTSDGWGVDIYDLVDPGQPARRGRASAPYDIRRLCYDKGLLYAAMWDAGVAIYETTAVGITERGQTVQPSYTRLRAEPNPVSNRLRIFGAGRVAPVVLYDAVGRTVGIEATKSEGGVIELNMAGLRSGVYFIEVIENRTTEVLRVVKP